MPYATQLSIEVSFNGMCIGSSSGCSFGLSTTNTPSFLHPALYIVNPLHPSSHAAWYKSLIVSTLVSLVTLTVLLILASIYLCHLACIVTLSNGSIFCAVAILSTFSSSINSISIIFCIIGVYTL